MNKKTTLAVLNATQEVVEIRPEISTAPVRYYTNWANKPTVMMLACNKPVKGRINDCECMKIIYVNFGLKYEHESHLCSNEHDFKQWWE